MLKEALTPMIRPLILFNFEITVELAGQQLLRVGQQIALLWS
jgi:hypothetical protein